MSKALQQNTIALGIPDWDTEALSELENLMQEAGISELPDMKSIQAILMSLKAFRQRLRSI